MATRGWYKSTSIKSLEDLSADACQYHAFAVDDAKLANNGEEATGILINKPGTNEHATVGYVGEMPYAAGAALTAGDKLTVTTSGWFIAADSSDPVVGQTKTTATSGSVGTGFFAFGPATYQARGAEYEFTSAASIQAGMAYDASDNKVADDGDGHSGAVVGTVNVSSTIEVVVSGVARVMVGGGTVNAGTKLTVTTSGYYVTGDSGDFIVGKMLASTTSGSTGDAYIFGTGVYEGA
jgi:hypothetical protein